MKVERCKGFKDFVPEDMKRFRLIENIFRDICFHWGYHEIRTPTLEYLYLFTSAGTLTPGKLRRVYSFLDWDGWSGERVVLKPEATIPVARYYIDNPQKGFSRLFYVTNVFMFEETGREPRERWQCGAELIGGNSVITDSELVMLALNVLKKLGLNNLEVTLSHAGLIRAFLDEMELDPQEHGRIFDRILDGELETLANIKPVKPELIQVLGLLLKLKGKSPGLLKNIRVISARTLPGLIPALDNFITIIDLLEKTECNYKIDLSYGKGFEYYTGVIFHFSVDKEIVGGGGRYDQLIPQMGGSDIPAAGFALYMDRLSKLIKAENIDTINTNRVLVDFAPKVVKEGFKIATLLRESGLIVELASKGQQETEYDWVIELKSKSPTFVINNPKDGRKLELDSFTEVMRLLGCN
ncbi:MAG: ATP phosphoribosyltransferase regulatory subunit [Dehalococcoidia bacterium]|nr:MAG: ATP phosphoribosyltransferase regulatory subunit [Dehalococcoidia bacterium]